MSALTLSKLVSPPWYYEPRRAVNRSRCAGNWTGIRLRSLLLGLDYEAEAEDACPLLGETGLHRVFGPVRGTNQLGTETLCWQVGLGRGWWASRGGMVFLGGTN